jgi:beta-galactosidase
MPRISRRNLLSSGLAVSASSLLARSAWGRAAALLGSDVPGGSAAAAPAVAPREQLLLDFGWKFTLGHASDPSKDLGFGFGQGDFSKTGEFEFATAGFDDSKWRTLNLPHDWAVELPFVHDESRSRTAISRSAGAIRRPAWAGIGANSRFPPATWAKRIGSSSTALSATCWSS